MPCLPDPAHYPLTYYNPETYLFPTLARTFKKTGQLDPLALYLILDWKAARMRTRQLDRLARICGVKGFDEAARCIAADLHGAAGCEQRFRLLMEKWKFLLPTASAVLAVLYPDTFTIYDARVCDQLGAFHELGNRQWSAKLWAEYLKFVSEVRKAAVREGASTELSLRDCDRWLWGRNKQKAMCAELARSRTGQSGKWSEWRRSDAAAPTRGKRARLPAVPAEGG